MPRRSALGPWDQRKKVRRCEHCAGRKVKCVGGIPCELCIRTGKTCRQRSTEPADPVFVLYDKKKAILLPRQMAIDTKTLHLDSFVAFLRRNQFVHHADTLVEILLPLVNTSSLLRSIVEAIGALDASRHATCVSYAATESPRFLALKSYSSSIESLSTALRDSMVSQRDDILWATFFLGLFELMIDPSGNGWAKHMLHGTSRLLQAAGPEQAISDARRAFLHLFRIFEANRAVLFAEDTILSSIDWAPVFATYENESHKGTWNSLDRVSSVMVQISTFNARFYRYIATVADVHVFDPFLEHLGMQAAEIQDAVSSLHAATIETGLVGMPSLQYYQTLLYCHTMSIFLFNTFDYYQCWDLVSTPYLSTDEIDRHVDHILQLAEDILNSSGGSGVLLIFPLRVAGTRVSTDLQKAKILALLDRIGHCGFIVANTIRDDVQEFWDWKAKPPSSMSKTAKSK